jgi:hypothetical protein
MCSVGGTLPRQEVSYNRVLAIAMQSIWSDNVPITVSEELNRGLWERGVKEAATRDRTPNYE